MERVRLRIRFRCWRLSLKGGFCPFPGDANIGTQGYAMDIELEDF